MFGAYHGFTVCTGARYFDGYIGDDESKGHWIKNHTDKWERKNREITEMAGKYPQESYASVVLAIQSEWIFFNM